MAAWSQSHFLQALGWATLNSFWQMALLWCLFIAINSIFKLSSEKRYLLATASIVGGFAWFLISFTLFFSNTEVSSVAFLNRSISRSNSLVNVFLISASVAYLILLIFPSYRLFKNWKYVQRIKTQGLEKAALNYRLYVQKIAGQLGIKKKVMVYLSDLVTSPVTVGYFKPIILLPIAAFNHLTMQQAEAILLHELSHIRRSDYIVNLIISIISTILYFNPFVKQFMKLIEEERENCCDQLVLHYGYDKVSYASALLTLEKSSAAQQVLALGAAGKKNLLGRIENIIGMEKKNRFKLNQLTGLLAAFFFIAIFNSVLIIKEEKHNNRLLSLAYNDITNPFHYFEQEDADQPKEKLINEPKNYNYTAEVQTPSKKTFRVTTPSPEINNVEEASGEDMGQSKDVVNVNFDEVDGSLTKEQKEQVYKTIKDTKKVVENLQWKNIESTIADAMTEEEKANAKQEYINHMDQSVNWKNIENNLKSKYQDVDWQKINTNLNGALTLIQLDSIEKTYTLVLNQLDKAKAEACNKSMMVNPLPDQSIEAINKSRIEIRKNLKLVQALKNKKIIKL